MILRSSMLHCASNCQAEGYYRYHLGLVPRGSGVNKDLFFGTAVHKGIEVGLQQSESVALSYLDSLLWPPGKVKTKDTAKILVRKYLTAFSDRVIATEKISTFSIGKHTWKLRYDIISENAEGVVVNENKTTNPSYLNIKPNSQFISYYIAAQREYPTFSRFKVWSLDPAFLEIHILPVYFSAAEISEWLRVVEAFADNIEKVFTEKTFLMNDSQCIRFRNRLCPYHDICTSQPDMRERLITSLYEINEEVKNLVY